MKRLYKSRTDRVIAGVCGGVGEYFELDPVLIRIVWVLLAILGGSGILAYIVGMIIIPEPPLNKNEADEGSQESSATAETAASSTFAAETAQSKRSTSQTVWGVVLVVIGFIVLLDQFQVFRFFSPHFWRVSWSIIFPIFLIIIGAIVLYRRNEEPARSTVSERTDYSGEKEPGRATKHSSLFRTRHDRKLAGVCGGMGYYLKIDPTIIRLLWIIGTFATGGVAVLIYIILAIVLPEGDVTDKTAEEAA